MSSNATVTDLATKPTAVTYSAINVVETVTDAEGNVKTSATIKPTQNQKEIDKATTAGNVLYSQSFSYELPSTVEGISLLGIPEEEIVNIFRKGLTAKANYTIVALMKEVDDNGNPTFQPVEGNYDLRAELAEVSGRVRLTDFEKGMKMLSNLPPEVIAAFLATQGKSPESAG